MCNHCYLGGFIGEPAGQASFVQNKIHHWIADVQCFSKIAEKQPQAVFAALTINHQIFLLAVFGCEVTPHEHLLFSLPVHFGGLGVFCPQCTAEFTFSASRDATQVIVQALHGSKAFEVDCHKETVLRTHKDFVRQNEFRYDEFFPPCCLNLMECVTDLWSRLS